MMGLNNREILEALLRGEILQDTDNKNTKLRLRDTIEICYYLIPWSTIQYDFMYHKWELEPKTININGIEVPKPLCDIDVCSLDIVYVVNLITEQLYSEIVFCKQNPGHEAYLERRLLHSTREGAATHALALLSLTETQP